MKKEIPIVCSLTDGELHERRRDVLDKLAASLIGAEELTDGFRYRFPATDALLQDLIYAINLERACCPFLSFNLKIEAGENSASLDLIGGPGAKEAIQKLFNWSIQPAAGI